jgi:hypothetical protein
MALLAALSDYRRSRAARKTVRKLKQLRTRTSRAGYTLRSFDRHRCIFVHIPKCAGVSVCRSLFGDYGAGHYPIRVFQEVFEPPLFDSYFKFAFVRNPWDRLLSAYRFLSQGGFNETDRRWARRYLSPYREFGEFVRDWVTPDNIASWIHFRPQVDFLSLANGKSGVDFVGRYEQLDADFRRVCERIGVKNRLLHLNSNGHRGEDYRPAYDTETRAIVAEVYGRDIAALGYDFDDDDIIPAACAPSQEHGKQNDAED